MTMPVKQEDDGVTHINIWSRAKTELGQKLSHFSHMPFVHPYFGPFESLEGFWYYTKAPGHPDDLRHVWGNRAKELGKQATRKERLYIKNFPEIITDANFHRIDQNPELKKLFLACDLPFDHYYLFGPGDVMIRPKGADWMIRCFEDIRALMLAGETPAVPDYSTINIGSPK